MDNLIGQIVSWDNKSMGKIYIGFVKSLSFPNQCAMVYGIGENMPKRFLAPIKELQIIGERPPMAEKTNS